MSGRIEIVYCIAPNGAPRGEINDHGYDESLCQPIAPIQFALVVGLCTIALLIVFAYTYKRIKACLNRNRARIVNEPIAIPITQTADEEMKEQNDAMRTFSENSDSDTHELPLYTMRVVDLV